MCVMKSCTVKKKEVEVTNLHVLKFVFICDFDLTRFQKVKKKLFYTICFDLTQTIQTLSFLLYLITLL